MQAYAGNQGNTENETGDRKEAPGKTDTEGWYCRCGKHKDGSRQLETWLTIFLQKLAGVEVSQKDKDQYSILTHIYGI